MNWFGRKRKNRRLGHEQVLDVRLRSDQIRASRMRLVAISLALVFATIFGFYIVWRTGELVLNRFVYENNAFAVEQIDVQTDGVIAPDQLRRWSGVNIGDNLLALDLGRVKRDVELVSTVRTVAVERVLPHTLRLRVSERDPLAQVRALQMRAGGGVEMGVMHVDAEGYMMTLLDPRFRAVPAAQTNDFLPTITGLNQNELIPGHRLESVQAQSALQLIAAFDRSPMSGLVELTTIDVSSPEVLQVTTGQGSQVTLSLLDLDRQLRRWREINDQGRRYGKAIFTLDLSVSNSIPARWIDAAAAPQGVPKIKNPQRNRKNNV